MRDRETERHRQRERLNNASGSRTVVNHKDPDCFSPSGYRSKDKVGDRAFVSLARYSCCLFIVIALLYSDRDPACSHCRDSRFARIAPGSRTGKLPKIPRHFWARTYLECRRLELTPVMAGGLRLESKPVLLGNRC